MTLSDSDSKSSSIHHFADDFSRNQSSSAMSDKELSRQLDGSQDSDDSSSSDKMATPPAANVAVDIVPVSRIAGFVLFGMSGSRRLQIARLRLAQIAVEEFEDDDSFFDELINQYRKSRRYFRWTLSIWYFHTCESGIVSHQKRSHHSGIEH